MAAGRRVEQIAMSEMPRPGDTITGFFVQQGRCFRMVYSDQLQATHCYQPPAWKGVWRDAKGRSHYVEACRENAPKYEEVSAMPSVVGTLYLQKCVDVRVIPQPNVQVIHHWAPAILSTPSHLLAPVDARR
jgi:hypothetical protein